MRPTFHFTAERGWINDPHGVTFRDGRYEIFYQHVPDSLEWMPDCRWGHATSEDLFSFEHQPVAIAPGDGDGGIWTGCVVETDNGPLAFYTAVSTPDFAIGRVRVATPADEDWNRWRKGDVVATAPAELALTAFRDPFVLRDAEGWRMLVGGALTDGSAAAVSFVSDDLARWRYDGVAARRSAADRDPVWTGALWECPQVFELDGRHVLVTSVWEADVLHYAAYGVGEFVSGRFTATRWGRLTYGDSYYAPSFFRDAEGRACLMLWLRGLRDDANGWAGAHSVPQVLRLDGDRLIAEPHPGLEALRRSAGAAPRVSGLAADVRWTGQELDVLSGGRVVLSLARRERTLVVGIDGVEHSLPVAAEIRMLLDGPVLEISSTEGIYAAAIAPSGDHLEFRADGDLTVFAVGPE